MTILDQPVCPECELCGIDVFGDRCENCNGQGRLYGPKSSSWMAHRISDRQTETIQRIALRQPEWAKARQTPIGLLLDTVDCGDDAIHHVYRWLTQGEASDVISAAPKAPGFTSSIPSPIPSPTSSTAPVWSATRLTVENCPVPEGRYLVDNPATGQRVLIWIQHHRHWRSTATSAPVYVKIANVPTHGNRPSWVNLAPVHKLTPPDAALIIKDYGEQRATEAYGHAVGSCGICGRALTDPESIAAGVGPVCSGKRGWRR